MNLLLISNDKKQCSDFENEIMPQNLLVLYIANDCNAAFDKLDSIDIDVILLDLEFHNANGDGMYFLQKFNKKECIYRRPYIIVITENTSDNEHSVARKYGADYIFTKSNTDYSPREVIDLASVYFQANKDIVPPQNRYENHIKEIIAIKLGRLGKSHTTGLKYLIDAIYITMRNDSVNLSKDVYPVLAHKYKKATSSIQKAMRVTIENAWRSENVHLDINFNKSIPSNKELICYYANKFKYDIY